MSELAATAPPALGMSVNELETPAAVVDKSTYSPWSAPELETPAAVVDLDRLERNIARVASYAAEHELGLIPHVKTHKSIAIARRQLDGGADGLTVAKSSEAEVFSALGAPLLVHYPVVGSAKLENAFPRPGSHRCAAFTSPTEATWTRSSSGSAPRR